MKSPLADNLNFRAIISAEALPHFAAVAESFKEEKNTLKPEEIKIELPKTETLGQAMRRKYMDKIAIPFLDLVVRGSANAKFTSIMMPLPGPKKDGTLPFGPFNDDLHRVLAAWAFYQDCTVRFRYSPRDEASQIQLIDCVYFDFCTDPPTDKKKEPLPCPTKQPELIQWLKDNVKQQSWD